MLWLFVLLRVFFGGFSLFFLVFFFFSLWWCCCCCFVFFRLWLHMPEGEALWSWSVTHRFFGDTLLFVGFSSSFHFGIMKTKELGLFFSLNLAARKKEAKRRNVFLFFHLFALCADWTFVALTAGFKFCFLWVGGTAREEEKPWKEKNLDEHELVCYFKFFNHWLSAFQLLPGYSSVF